MHIRQQAAWLNSHINTHCGSKTALKKDAKCFIFFTFHTIKYSMLSAINVQFQTPAFADVYDSNVATVANILAIG